MITASIMKNLIDFFSNSGKNRTNFHLFKMNYGNNKTMCEICSNLTIDTTSMVSKCFCLTLSRCHTFFSFSSFFTRSSFCFTFTFFKHLKYFNMTIVAYIKQVKRKFRYILGFIHTGKNCYNFSLQQQCSM